MTLHLTPEESARRHRLGSAEVRAVRRKRPWRVTWQNKRGGIQRRRFYTEYDARLFIESVLHVVGVHPTAITLEETG